MTPEAGPALAAAARLGPYFAWLPHDGDSGRQPLGTLTDPEVVAGRVEVARQTLCRMSGLGPDRIEERAVASTVFLGLASRLLSPMLAAVALTDTVPLPDPARMWWQPVGGGPVPITVRDLPAADCAGQDATEVAGLLTRAGVRVLVEPVLEVFRARFALSPQVLWGNVASALGGAVSMIADHAPGSAARGATVVGEMLAGPPLAGMATLTRPDPARDRWFLVRRNCCLYYRIPGGGFCGDCVLTPDDARRRHWQSVLTR